MRENNNLTEAEIKEYYELDDKEKQIMLESFEVGIKETIKDFLNEKYGSSFYSEDDVRARLYHHIVKSFDKPNIDKRKLISAINFEMKTTNNIRKRQGELDITAMTSNKKESEEDFDIVVCMEIKYNYKFYALRKNKLLEEIKKPEITGKLLEKMFWDTIIEEKIKDDFKKLKDELITNPDAKTYFLFFDTHNKDEEFEKTEAKNAEKILEILRDGKNITYVYVIRYSDYSDSVFGKKSPFKTGIVKSNNPIFMQL